MKKTYEEIRRNVLLSLFNGKKTINEISRDSGVNWKTVQRHLTYLKGIELVSEVFSSPYVRIFDLTEKAREKII